MAGEKVNLSGIHFRAYQLTFEDDAEAEAYDPAGPGTADDTPGAVDLGCIAIRAWEDADLANESEGGSAGSGGSGSIGGGGSGGGGGGGSGGGETPPVVDEMVPSESLFPSEGGP